MAIYSMSLPAELRRKVTAHVKSQNPNSASVEAETGGRNYCTLPCRHAAMLDSSPGRYAARMPSNRFCTQMRDALRCGNGLDIKLIINGPCAGVSWHGIACRVLSELLV